MTFLGLVVSLSSILFLWFDSYTNFNLCKSVFHWLKGSQKIYYIDSSGYARLTSDSLSWVLASIKRDDSIIVVRRGFWRRRSAIYGPAAKNWQIVEASLGCNPQGGFGDDWVDLRDRGSLHAESAAIRLINNYPSLQTVLDENRAQRNQIAELEWENTELKERAEYLGNVRVATEDWVIELWSSMIAIAQIMEEDRQRYRSKAAAHVNQCLTMVHDWMATEVAKASPPFLYLKPSPAKIQIWKKNRFPVMKD